MLSRQPRPCRRQGFLLPVAQCDAEAAFPDNHFDCVTHVAFGPAQHDPRDQAIAEMRRDPQAGRRLLVLEFSKV